MPGVITRLQGLKVRQLQNIALSIGILSSGTKKDLINRLSETFQKHNLQSREDGSTSRDNMVASRPQKNRNPEPMSILSIDMGIRNLAYAHLLVSSRGVLEARVSKTAQDKPLSLSGAKVYLNAWDRLAISSFPAPDMEEDPPTIPISNLGGLGTTTLIPPSCLQEEERQVEKETKEHFAPYLYASHAYTLITSLMEAYKPTHVLIERQRFRSGGGSAVQEWTIRVGVFEGMLYAVLHTLRRQGKGEQLGKVFVQGVDPQRVVRYWTNDEKKEEATPDSKKKVSSKEGKKAKIDLIGRCLSRCAGIGGYYTPTGSAVKERPKQEISMELDLVDDSQARDIVHAYLEKWNGGNNVSKKRATLAAPGKNKGNIENIGKLDDLADSLLQGITWLEWQKTTEKLLYNDAAIPT
ncbi:hypothetical protein MauCBS54593_004199 [Microsporum audouinii]